MAKTGGRGKISTTTSVVVMIDPASVIDAVIVCSPVVSEVVLKVPPEPMDPSKLEVQAMLAVMSPSSVSEAVPVQVTVSPKKKVAPVVGDEMLTVGGVFVGAGSVTPIPIVSTPVNPPLSVTAAWTVWDPAESRVVVKEAPPPIVPSRSVVQAKIEEIVPSSVSMPVPAKLIGSPSVKVAASAGDVMVTTGLVLMGAPLVPEWVQSVKPMLLPKFEEPDKSGAGYDVPK